MTLKSVPWGVAQPGVWVEDPQVQAALWSREENVHSAVGKVGLCRQKSSKAAGSRSVLEFESSGFGDWLDMWPRKGRTPVWLPDFWLEPQGDSDG